MRPKIDMDSSDASPPVSGDWLDFVRQKVGRIDYGSIQITIHDGRVTLLEVAEKVRIQTAKVPNSETDS